MKKFLLILTILISSNIIKGQTCEDIMGFVKSQSYGSSYTSYGSDAISKVTFYSLFIDYSYQYFAIVCFKEKYSYGCREYIYQVGSNTKMNYSMEYHNSAGKAFWEYIQPYSDVLGCSPNFD